MSGPRGHPWAWGIGQDGAGQVRILSSHARSKHIKGSMTPRVGTTVAVTAGGHSTRKEVVARTEEAAAERNHGGCKCCADHIQGALKSTKSHASARGSPASSLMAERQKEAVVV